MAVTTRPYAGEIEVLVVDADPDGSITAPQGSLASDKANAKLYQNTDGATAWAEIGAVAPTEVDVDTTSDGYWDDFEFTAGASDLEWNAYATDDNRHKSFCLFESVPIPNGATIITAYITVTAFAASSDVLSVDVSAHDVDDAAAPVASGGADTMLAAKTTADATWVLPTFVQDTEYTGPEIKAVIQEVVDRGGWATGQDMLIFVVPSAGSNNEKHEAHAIEDPDPGTEMHLHVEYTT